MKTRERGNLVLVGIGVITIICLVMCCITPLQAQSGKEDFPIIIGVAEPLGAAHGQDVLRCVQLAAEEINAKGGVRFGGKQHKVKVVSTDTREHEPGMPVHDALAAIEKLIIDHKPHFIIGGYRSEVCLAVFDLIAKYKIPYLTSIVMTPKFDEKVAAEPEKYKYMFRIGGTSTSVAEMFRNIIDELRTTYGLKKISFNVADVLAWRTVVEQLMPFVKQTGWEVTDYSRFPLGSSDFSSAINKAKVTNTDVMFSLYDVVEEGSLLTKQAYRLKSKALLIGFIEVTIAEMSGKTLKNEVDGIVNMLQEAGNAPVKAILKSVEFQNKYGKRWGEDLRQRMCGHGPSPTYDATFYVCNAIERAGGVDNMDAVVKEIERTSFDGTSGKVIFNKTHSVIYGFDPKKESIGAMFQWQNGKRVMVFPQTIAESHIKLKSK